MLITSATKFPYRKLLTKYFSSSSSCSKTDKYKLGNNAIVTGASTGIGHACVKALLENGVKNIAMGSARNVKKGEEEMYKLRRKYPQSCMTYMKCDVTNCDEIKALFDCAMDCFGSVDIILNNAGIFVESEWSRMVDINLKGVIYGTFYGMQMMSKSKGGKGGAIVNVASILGLDPMAGAPVYTATKHGIIGFTKSMALPFHYKSSGVRVMAMCPGVTMTPLIQKASDLLTTGDELAKQAAKDLAGLKPQQ